MMTLHFLGTGAADWTKKNAKGEFRCLTSTLVDEDLLIDVNQAVLARIPDPSAVKYVFFTHSHSDHFNIEALRKLAPCTVYAHSSWAGEIEGDGLTVVPVEVGVKVMLPDGTAMLPLPANHATQRACETTLHYVVERGGKCLLYALDGAWLLNGAYKLIRHHVFDAAVFDATIGDGYEDYRIFEHSSVSMVRIMVDMMRKTGQLKPDAPVFLNHLARTLHPDRETLEKSLERPLVACFDGMRAVV